MPKVTWIFTQKPYLSQLERMQLYNMSCFLAQYIILQYVSGTVHYTTVCIWHRNWTFSYFASASTIYAEIQITLDTVIVVLCLGFFIHYIHTWARLLFPGGGAIGRGSALTTRSPFAEATRSGGTLPRFHTSGSSPPPPLWPGLRLPRSS